MQRGVFQKSLGGCEKSAEDYEYYKQPRAWKKRAQKFGYVVKGTDDRRRE